ncbi:MAG: biotin/lipoate A/B protein ligase family protein, partial [Candidatus Bathyarchaeia archaeon]
EKMCQGVLFGLRMLGVQADFRPKNDVEVDGRKISGTGGTERDEAFLFQGTLLVDFDVETMLQALRIPVMKLKDKEIESVKERVTCLRWELGHTPGLEEIKNALKAGFEKAFEIRLVEDGLSRDEENLWKTRQRFTRSPRRPAA